MEASSDRPAGSATAACPFCGGQVSAGAKFCGHCGQTLPVAHTCTACGEELAATAKFCPVCGAPQGAPAAKPPARQAAPARPPAQRRGRSQAPAPPAAEVGKELASEVPDEVEPAPPSASAVRRRAPQAAQKRPRAVRAQPQHPARKRSRLPLVLLLSALALLTCVCLGVAISQLGTGPGNPPDEEAIAASDGSQQEPGDAMPPAADPAVAEVITRTVTPAEGAVLRGEFAAVEIRPDALSEPADVKVEAGWDGRMVVTLDPPQALAIPALVTLPMPPGGAAGTDPATWPVAILDPGTEGALLLLPETISADSFSVLVPHFSEIQAALQGTAGSQMPGLQTQPPTGSHDPNDFEYTINLPRASSTDAKVAPGEMSLVLVQVKARALAGFPPNVDPPWDKFKGLRVKIYAGEVAIQFPNTSPPAADVELVNGQSKELPTQLTLAGNAPFTTLLVRLESAQGEILADRTVTVPHAKYWAVYNCQAGQVQDFQIQYLYDPQMSGYPDHDYTSALGPDGDVPGRVLDACNALSDAYNLLLGPRGFNDPDHAPGLPMAVRLQPWADSYSGNVANYLIVSTKNLPTYDAFKLEVAHEMAHRFQHQYSIGYTGHWFHEASAEYLARHIYDTPDTLVGAFVCADCNADWISRGLDHPEKENNYAASSFLAYLRDRQGMDIGQLWVQGATGWGNLSSWEAYLDAQLAAGGGLGQAWQTFAQAYLVDHAIWGDWNGFIKGKAPDSIWASFDQLVLLTTPDKKHALFSEKTVPSPCLSGGGIGIKYSGTPAVTIGVAVVPLRVTSIGGPASPGSVITPGARPGSTVWINPGMQVDGRGALLTPADTNGSGGWKGDFRLGATDGALSPQMTARVTFVAPVLDSCAGNLLRVEARALPMLEAKLDREDLFWVASPLEAATDRYGRSWFGAYEIVQKVGGQYTVLATLPAGTTTVNLASLAARPQEGHPVCVRLKDAEGVTSPEACPAVEDFSRRLCLGPPKNGKEYEAYVARQC